MGKILNPTVSLKLSAEDVSRVIEMAWEDRTPFEAIVLNLVATSHRSLS
jgi:hypothetical protein